jgi:hypothetical protein
VLYYGSILFDEPNPEREKTFLGPEGTARVHASKLGFRARRWSR